MTTRAGYLQYAKECEERSERLEKQIVLINTERQGLIAQRDAANKQYEETKSTLEDLQIDYGSLRERYDEQSTAVEELQQRVSELEAERQQFVIQLDEAKRRNDDLSINNAHLEMELKKWSESHGEAMRHGLQLEKQLSEIRQTSEARLENYKMMCDRADRARRSINQWLAIFWGRQERPASLREMSTEERFAYLLQDTLDGK